MAAVVLVMVLGVFWLGFRAWYEQSVIAYEQAKMEAEMARLRRQGEL